MSETLFRLIRWLTGPLLIVAIVMGPIYAGVVSLLVTPVLMAFVAWKFEPQGRLRQVLNLKTQSWQYLIGDVLGIMPAVVAVSWAVSMSDVHLNLKTAIVLFASFFIGSWAGDVFHILERARYEVRGAGPAMKSPTKRIHDHVIISAEVSALIFGVVMGFEQINTTVLLVLVSGIGFWVMMGAADAVRGLDPKQLHPNQW